MAEKRFGKQTIKLSNPPSIISTATIVGPAEGKGPLKDYFDQILEDDKWGQESWEKCEAKLQEEAIRMALMNASLSEGSVDYLFAGDLLNQIISSSYAARQLSIPYFGLYGACSTMTESLSLGSMAVDGGFADNVVCVTSSHFSTAERQFRFPLEFGSQRPFSSQRTVTGAGACIVSSVGNGPYVTYVTTGRVIDAGIIDANNMGAAMAPAAVDTIEAHFRDLNRDPSYYDIIATGDLGKIGHDIAEEILKKDGFKFQEGVFKDCGKLIYKKDQPVFSGGSGCACSATVTYGHFFKEMKKKKLNKILVVATGALMSPMSYQQKESIPSVAHAVSIEA